MPINILMPALSPTMESNAIVSFVKTAAQEIDLQDRVSVQQR